MVEHIAIFLVGILFGAVVTVVAIAINEDGEKITKVEPPIFYQEKNIVIANAELSIPEEDMRYPVSSEWIERQLSHKLAEEIWKYAMVCKMVDKRNMCHTYIAKLKVVDMGQLNPFGSYGERKYNE